MGVKLNKALEILRMAIQGRSLEELRNIFLNSAAPKEAQEFMVYQRSKSVFNRSADNDRVFPFETISLHKFSSEHQSNLDTAIIHTGPYADELAMRMNALAVVFGEDIFFRNGAYKPESEEGRKILTHELTHVAQHSEKRTAKNIDREELEREAELAETQAVYDPDPYEPYIVGDKVFSLRKSQIATVIKLTADDIEEWLSREKYSRTEEKYLKLLCAYDEWVDEEM